jgi:HEAT repeat protein
MPGPPSSSPQRRADRRTFAAIAALVALWILVVLCRNPIRAYWWTHKLATAADPQVRLSYFQRLIALGPTGAAAVGQLLTSPDAALRGLGVAILNHAKPRQARKLLVRMSADPDSEVSAMAVTGLALLGDPTVVEDLARLLESSEERRAVLAVSGLGRLRTPPAVELLIETARSHAQVAARVEAIEELGQLRVVRAAEVLRACLNDDTPFAGRTVSEQSAAVLLGQAAPGMQVVPPLPRPVSYFAARALRAITAEDLGTNGS